MTDVVLKLPLILVLAGDSVKVTPLWVNEFPSAPLFRCSEQAAGFARSLTPLSDGLRIRWQGAYAYEKTDLRGAAGFRLQCGGGADCNLSGLVSVKIYEQTSGLATYTYSPGASELATQLSGALAFGNADAVSLAAEFYDFWFGTFVRVMLPRARTSRWRACRTRWMATSQLRL
jgi:hypothetical protein